MSEIFLCFLNNMQGQRSSQKSKGSRLPKNKSKKSSGQVDSVPLVSNPNQFKTLSLVFPPRMLMKLKYWTQIGLVLTVNTFANYRFRPTAAFDVDPALGGTAMAGFAEASAFYQTYRVSKSAIKVTLLNPSTTLPVTLIVLPMNADPTNSFGVANIIASMGNPYAVSKTSGSSAFPARVSAEMTTKKIFGDAEVLFDHNFTALVTTVPNNNWFWNVCVLSPAVIATAVYAIVEIEVDCEFYDRNFLPA
jgi:hypothetical protein